MRTFINRQVIDGGGEHNVTGQPDYAPRPRSASAEELYDLTGVAADPLRMARLAPGERYFAVHEGGKARSYLMPALVPNLRAMKDHIHSSFPLDD